MAGVLGPGRVLEPGLFADRIRERGRLWWGKHQRGASWARWAAAIHRMRRRQTFLSRDSPAAAWHCCPYWQHTLLNKWNGREFAQGLGVRVPALYWRGHVPSRARLAALPHVVVRPVWGTGRRGVYVVSAGRELLRQRDMSPRELHATLLRSLPARRGAPIMLEAFVRGTAGESALPLEIKVHAFAGHVAAVQTMDRKSIYADGVTQRVYTPEWRPFDDPMDLSVPLGPLIERPACLDEMLECAARLGRALGAYMRIDFFAGQEGCVFNEFSSTPRIAAHVTPFADRFFAAAWDEHCPGTS